MNHYFRFFSITIFKIGFIGIALWLILNKIDFIKFKSFLTQPNYHYFIIAIILSILSLICGGFRSYYYFQKNRFNLPLKYLIYLYFVGNFFNLAFPGGVGGDGYRIFHINKSYKFSKLSIFKIFLFERVNGFYVLCVIGFITFYFTDFSNLKYALTLNTSLLILITPIYILGIKYVLKDDLKIAIGSTLYSLAAQILQVISAFALIRFLLPNGEIIIYMNFIFLFIAASLLSIIPVSIGSIGVRELTLLYGLELIAKDSFQTLGITFATASFFIYVIVALAGLPFYYILRKKSKA